MENDFDHNSSFYHILDAIPISIYWKDALGQYLGCNKYMSELAGLSRKSIIGKTDHDLIWKDAAEDIHHIEQIVIKNKAKYEVEEVSTMGTSRQRIFLSTKTPLYNSSWDVIGIIGVSIDITDRKKVEQLQKEREVAEQVSKAVEMLAGCIAHEMRTPLSIIELNTDKLQMAEQKNKIKIINNINSAIKGASNIIDMFLIKLRSILTKQVSGHKFKSNSIKSSINNVISEYPFYNDDREKIVWNDKSNEDFTYMGDSLFTKHILFNLIKNALRAIKEAEHGKIYISLRTNRDFNYIIFKDTASGIPDEVLKTLFQQFSSNSAGGTGLGLAFCKMTMQTYGGDIVCDSEEGKYTEFKLSFPVINATT